MYSATAYMDSGSVFRFGWENGTLFDIEPLSGTTVEIHKSQGFQQIGETIEGQSMVGINRTIKGVCMSQDAAWSLVRAFPAFSSGRLSVGGYFCDFVVSKTPQIVKKKGKTKFSMQIFCSLPYWQSETETAVSMGEIEPAFAFPTELTEFSFGTRDSSAFVNAQNTGSLQVPIDIEFTAGVDVSAPGVTNAITGETITVTGTLRAGETIRIRRNNGEMLCELTTGGVTSSILGRLDPASTLYWVHPGDNLLKAVASSNAASLVTTVRFRPAENGVVV